MTDYRAAGPSEFTWYSRLATWIGAAMLLVQSILGRDAGPVTVLAVLLLGIGFLCFLAGLVVDSRPQRAEEAEDRPRATRGSSELNGDDAAQPERLQTSGEAVEPAAGSRSAGVPVEQVAPQSLVPEPARAPTTSGPGRRPKFRERAKKSETRLPRSAGDNDAPTPPVESRAEPPVPAPIAPTTAVTTEMLTSASPAVGTACVGCGRALQAGQLAARCPQCDRVQHAVCWMENQFRCGAPDCTGRGSLEAPVNSEAERAPTE